MTISLTSSTAASDLVQPTAGGWCAAARPDPITELIAFPDFHMEFPRRLSAAVRNGHSVGLAIGDVDHLKEYVQSVNDNDPFSFGHLAGNALMRDLGRMTCAWFSKQRYVRGCASTFGGDEVILAAEVPSLEVFVAQVTDLSRLLSNRLPRTVSFAAAVITPDLIEPPLDDLDFENKLYLHLVSSVDRCLFTAKAGRITNLTEPFISVADVSAPLRAGAVSNDN